MKKLLIFAGIASCLIFIFIVVLLFNKSEKTLSAFGSMYDKFEKSNSVLISKNNNLLNTINQRSVEDSHLQGSAKNTADKIASISKYFYEYIETLKADTGIEIKKETNKLQYENIEKAPLDDTWFTRNGYSKKGKEIVTTINKYVVDMKVAVASEPMLTSKLTPLISHLEFMFNTADVKDYKGVTKKYLEYHFAHYPAMASMAKLTAMQNDVLTVNFDIYTALLNSTSASQRLPSLQ